MLILGEFPIEYKNRACYRKEKLEKLGIDSLHLHFMCIGNKAFLYYFDYHNQIDLDDIKSLLFRYGYQFYQW